MDDATSRVDYAQLAEEESTASVMTALREVVRKKGVFCSLYSDRASHFVFTPTAGGRPDRSVKTQVGRALEQLGIELIPANSPQARGRCERLYGTFQGRLPQELRLRRIRSMEAANRFLRETYVGEHNRQFAVSASKAARLSSRTTAASWRKSSPPSRNASSATTIPLSSPSCVSRSRLRGSVSAWLAAECSSAAIWIRRSPSITALTGWAGTTLPAPCWARSLNQRKKLRETGAQSVEKMEIRSRGFPLSHSPTIAGR